LNKGDRLVVSELSRLGRSVGQVIAIKDDYPFRGQANTAKQGDGDPVCVIADGERDLTSERTKEGLAAARVKGKMLGRPTGSRGLSKLEGREQEIQMLLTKGIPNASIAKITDVSRTNLLHFIRTRQLGGA